MAAEMEGILPKDIRDVTSSKVLVVGAGGIGCELLKHLVLTGFTEIHIVDLDTIEVSNLNRQFLFRKEHVGRPKAIVAKESALVINPNVNITAYHDSITEAKYDVNFFKQFSVVVNALDNLAARSHVNRMCLAADLPLIESASAGFEGNVSCHKEGLSECYNCTERPRQETFPGCTIRNTPSEPIHCIVWAKHLFNQLFGIADEDQDVSPDSADPEAIGGAGKAALESEAEKQRVSTREWAKNHSYDARKLFQKFFHDDIQYLLSMSNLWVTRRAPVPLELDNLPDAVASSSSAAAAANIVLKDQRIWSIAECEEVFRDSINGLQKQFMAGNGEPLIWDKHDDLGMNFVTACSNIRCHVFGIQQKSRVDTKAMAGNIIPAIASTNAIVAGLIVMTAFNVLQQQFDKIKTLYVSGGSTETEPVENLRRAESFYDAHENLDQEREFFLHERSYEENEIKNQDIPDHLVQHEDQEIRKPSIVQLMTEDFFRGLRTRVQHVRENLGSVWYRRADAIPTTSEERRIPTAQQGSLVATEMKMEETELQSRHEQLRLDFANLQDEHLQLQQKLFLSDTEVKNLKSTVQQLEKFEDYTQLTSCVDALKQQLELVEAEKMFTQKELQNTTQELTNLKDYLSISENAFSELLAEKEDIALKLENIESRNQYESLELKEKLDELEKDLLVQKNKIMLQLENAEDQHQSEISELKEKLAELQQIRAELLADKDRLVSQLEHSEVEKESLSLQLQSTVSLNQRESLELKEKLDELEKIKELLVEKDKLMLQLENFNQSETVLVGRLSELEEIRTELLSDKERLVSQLEHAEAKNREQTLMLKETLEECERNVANLHAEKESLTLQLQNSESENEASSLQLKERFLEKEKGLLEENERLKLQLQNSASQKQAGKSKLQEKFANLEELQNAQIKKLSKQSQRAAASLRTCAVVLEQGKLQNIDIRREEVYAAIALSAEDRSIGLEKIASIDVDKIVQTSNIELLEELLSQIVHCRPEIEFESNGDSGFLKVFRVSQLMIEYYHGCVQALQEKYEKMAQKCSQAEEQSAALSLEVQTLKDSLSTARKELRRRKELLVSAQNEVVGSNKDEYDPCPYCSKRFLTTAYLIAHMQRRHQGLPCQPPFPIQNIYQGFVPNKYVENEYNSRQISPGQSPTAIQTSPTVISQGIQTEKMEKDTVMPTAEIISDLIEKCLREKSALEKIPNIPPHKQSVQSIEVQVGEEDLTKVDSVKSYEKLAEGDTKNRNRVREKDDAGESVKNIMAEIKHQLDLQWQYFSGNIQDNDLEELKSTLVVQPAGDLRTLRFIPSPMLSPAHFRTHNVLVAGVQKDSEDPETGLLCRSPVSNQVEERFQQQEKELEELKKLLQLKMDSDIIEGKLESQERYWRSKLRLVQEEYNFQLGKLRQEFQNYVSNPPAQPQTQVFSVSHHQQVIPKTQPGVQQLQPLAEAISHVALSKPIVGCQSCEDLPSAGESRVATVNAEKDFVPNSNEMKISSPEPTQRTPHQPRPEKMEETKSLPAPKPRSTAVVSETNARPVEQQVISVKSRQEYAKPQQVIKIVHASHSYSEEEVSEGANPSELENLEGIIIQKQAKPTQTEIDRDLDDSSGIRYQINEDVTNQLKALGLDPNAPEISSEDMKRISKQFQARRESLKSGVSHVEVGHDVTEQQMKQVSEGANPSESENLESIIIQKQAKPPQTEIGRDLDVSSGIRNQINEDVTNQLKALGLDPNAPEISSQDMKRISKQFQARRESESGVSHVEVGHDVTEQQMELAVTPKNFRRRLGSTGLVVKAEKESKSPLIQVLSAVRMSGRKMQKRVKSAITRTPKPRKSPTLPIVGNSSKGGLFSRARWGRKKKSPPNSKKEAPSTAEHVEETSSSSEYTGIDGSCSESEQEVEVHYVIKDQPLKSVTPSPRKLELEKNLRDENVKSEQVVTPPTPLKRKTSVRSNKASRLRYKEAGSKKIPVQHEPEEHQEQDWRREQSLKKPVRRSLDAEFDQVTPKKIPEYISDSEPSTGDEISSSWEEEERQEEAEDHMCVTPVHGGVHNQKQVHQASITPERTRDKHFQKATLSITAIESKIHQEEGNNDGRTISDQRRPKTGRPRIALDSWDADDDEDKPPVVNKPSLVSHRWTDDPIYHISGGRRTPMSMITPEGFSSTPKPRDCTDQQVSEKKAEKENKRGDSPLNNSWDSN